MTKRVLKEKKGIALGFLFLMLCMLLAQNVFAADVAYIYNKKFLIDNNIVDYFKGINLTVDLIPESKVLTTDFSKYKFLFLGDERFQYPKNIPLWKYPTIVSNYYHGPEWGLTDSDGISKLGRDSPMSVRIMETDDIVQVYTQGVFGYSRVAIPYYYLGNVDKAPSMEKIAATYSGNGFDLGDVISYANAGVHLNNGKVTQGKICFFGIVESDYWTEEAKLMFEDCAGFVGSSCYTDNDCDDETIGENYCINDSVYRDITEYKCINPGTIRSKCVGETTPELVEECSDTCIDGECVIIECRQDSDCGTDGFSGNLFCQNNDVFGNFITYKCNNPGQVTSSCSNSSSVQFKLDCGEDSCTDFGDNYCKGNNIYHSRTCNDKGCLSGSCFNTQSTDEQLVRACNANQACVNAECINIICSKNSDCDDSNAHTEDLCINPGTIDSHCIHNPINCLNDLECGTNGFVDGLFCMNNDVFQNYKTYKCNNPGKSNSYCSDSIEPKLKKDCVICVNGACANINCTKNSDCDDGNSYTVDECNNPGTTSSYCSNTQVNCVTNNDCGVTGFIGTEFCSQGNVFKIYQSSTCKNSGTTDSYCEVSKNTKLIVDCGEDYCTDFGDNYCKNGNVYHSKTCYDKGCNNAICTSSSSKVEELVKVCSSGCFNGNCGNIVCSKNSDCDDSNAHTEDVCINPGTIESYCVHKEIECLNNGECGTNGFSNELFCKNEDVFDKYITYTCMFPGTSSSYCTDSSENKLKIDCGEDYCTEFGDNYCKNGDVYHSRTCHDKGCSSGSCFDNTNNNEQLVQTCANGCNNGKCKNITITCYKDEDCDDENLYTLDECNNPGTSSSYCSHTVFNCITDNDCGPTGFIGDEFCSYGDVFKIYQSSTCRNPSTTNSYCEVYKSNELVVDCGEDYCTEFGENYCKNGDVYHSKTCYEKGCEDGACTSSSSIVEEKVESCENGCLNGECSDVICRKNSDCGEDYCEPFGENYCKNGDVYHSRTCYDKGCEDGECYDEEYEEEEIVEECSNECVNGMCEEDCNEAEQLLSSIYSSVNEGNRYDLSQSRTYAYCNSGDYLLGGAGEALTCDSGAESACGRTTYYQYDGPVSTATTRGWGSLFDVGGALIPGEDGTFDTSRTEAVCIPNNIITNKYFSIYIKTAGSGTDVYSLNQNNAVALCNAGDKVISGSGYAPSCDKAADLACNKKEILTFNGAVNIGGKEGWASQYNVNNDGTFDTVQTFAICLKKTSLFDDYLKVYNVVSQGANAVDQGKTSVYCNSGDIAIGGGGNLCSGAACYLTNYLEGNRRINGNNIQGWYTGIDLSSINSIYDTQRIMVTCIGFSDECKSSAY